MIEDESLSLLAEAAATLSPLEATPSPNALSGPHSGPRAKVSPKDGRRQFSLASLPFLTIYLQGIPDYLPPSLALDQPLPGSLALALDLGVLKLRPLPYPPLSPDTRSHYLTEFQTLIANGKAYTPEWLSATKELLAANPQLLESTNLARVQGNFLSSTRATQSLGEWLSTLPALPTNPTSTPTLSLDELSII